LIDRVCPNVIVDDGSLRYHISALRKSLRDGLDGSRYVINVAGRGYCFVASTTEPARAGSAPAGSAHAMPPRFTRMVGRDATVELISAQLMANRFVTLVGSGGIGKTTVAVSVGHGLAAEYDAVCFADLGSLSDPRLAPNLLAASLGAVVHTDEVIPSLVRRLNDERTLLILDSCEHVIETVSILAEAIFEQAPAVHILATSREALRVKGEHVHRLASLDCPPTSDTLTAAQAITYSAARLFSDRVFPMRDEDAPIVARICNKLDGIPLAIELAAGRVETHGVEGVDALLGSRLSLLWQGRRTAPPRQQTLNATLEWSYDLLTEAEQSILRRLTPFVGAFTLEGAEHLARDDTIDPDVVVAAIARLVGKSLIVSDIDGRRLRHRLLDTTRAYLRGKLAEAGEAPMVARRHAEYFRQFLEKAGAETRAFSEGRVLGDYVEDVGNVRSALEWSFSEGGDAQLGIALAAAAAPLFLEMSLLTECQRWTAKALAAHAIEGSDARLEMELQTSLGLSLTLSEGPGAAAFDVLKRALGIAERLGDQSAQLRVIGSLHFSYIRIADFHGSVALAERALEIVARMDDPVVTSVVEWMLGVSYHSAGDQRRALSYCRSALVRPAASLRPDVMRFGFVHRFRALCALARTQWLLGAADEATDLARNTLEEAEALEHAATLCVALLGVFPVYLWIGDLAEAETIIERLMSCADKHSLTPYQTVAMGLRGQIAVRRGDAPTAIPLLSRCLQIMRSKRHLVRTSVFAGELAQAMATSGRLDEALATIDHAISEVEGRGGSFDMPELLRLKGSFVAATGASNLTAAADCFVRSLDLARSQGALSLELRTALSMARLRADQGDHAGARDVLAPVCARFTQGLGTADLVLARSLLDALGSSSSK